MFPRPLLPGLLAPDLLAPLVPGLLAPEVLVPLPLPTGTRPTLSCRASSAGSIWCSVPSPPISTTREPAGRPSSTRGADLNRNFPFEWGAHGGSSGVPCDETFRGASAGSEPETTSVINYLRTIFPDVRPPDLVTPAPADTSGIFLDVHSYGQLVMWPWGFTNGIAPNGVGLTTLGRRTAYLNDYTPEQAIELYVTDGGEPGLTTSVLEAPCECPKRVESALAAIGQNRTIAVIEGTHRLLEHAFPALSPAHVQHGLVSLCQSPEFVHRLHRYYARV